jgi:hypothetical protein
MGPLWSPGAETPFLEFAKAGGWKTKLQIGGLFGEMCAGVRVMTISEVVGSYVVIPSRHVT